ncbi:MAG: methylated-DNA--[protein]-cysteine S-methyltransferase [Anaerolineales bacterium]|nr:methylated-DNA--[protein]-cysteine S-methyltransferase [Anaerolineales bacterium]
MDNLSMDLTQLSQDYLIIEKAIHYLEQEHLNRPNLDELAEEFHMSKFHFQRVFSRWAGISPKRFQQYITIEHARGLLNKGSSLLDTAAELGLSSPSRLHDLFVNLDAITPGDYKFRGEELPLEYGYAYTPFGECLMGISSRGICFLGFVQNEREEIFETLRETWPLSPLKQNNHLISDFAKRIFSDIPGNKREPLHLLVKGTNFQVKIWEALIRISFGEITTYQQVAQAVDNPKATRAVGSALAKNPIAYLIPCHRVIRQMGSFNQYRWGETRKKCMLGRESSISAISSGL